MITKKKALKITRELFTWLAENPDEVKVEWPGWKKYGEMDSNCALCQYNEEHDLNCDDDGCLIQWTEDIGSQCLEFGSPFKVWFYGGHTFEEMSQSALEVVALAVAAEKALKGG